MVELDNNILLVSSQSSRRIVAFDMSNFSEKFSLKTLSEVFCMRQLDPGFIFIGQKKGHIQVYDH